MRNLNCKLNVKLLGVSALLAISVLGAQAQAIFRIVAPDGTVTFSDKPPSQKDKATPLSSSGRTPAANTTSDSLPFDLRQIVSRFPVVLYTGDNCAPCNSGRSLLSTRGIPFTERTVTTQADGEALQKLSGETSLPFMTIGGQRIKGFADGEWSQFLDAAGYPKTSQLPTSYRNPPSAPLVAPPKPIPVDGQNATGSAPSNADNRSAPLPAGPTPENPAGIRF